MRPREGHLPLTSGGRLFYRDVGEGPPIVVLHGGPDFDHTYLLPELDRLASSFRLVYYDQRGRGRSGEGVDPASVGIDSDVLDVDAVRAHFGFDRVALFGHSWGGLLAMEYATRHPERVSHLVLANTAPASAADAAALAQHLRSIRSPEELAELRAVAASAAYRAGELGAETAYYRIHFRVAFRRPELLEALVARLRRHFVPAGVVAARAIEERLYEQTWRSGAYDLLPRLRRLVVPTLVLHGAYDFIPLPLVERIAEAVPRSRLVVLEDCGHFAYLEAPDAVHAHVAALFDATP